MRAGLLQPLMLSDRLCSARRDWVTLQALRSS